MYNTEDVLRHPENHIIGTPLLTRSFLHQLQFKMATHG
jgi:hypothetical protein